jgi:hypothetical protein
LQKSVRRILSAASISAAIYGGTWYWYQGTLSNTSDNGDLKPIAYADSVASDVKRRPSSRLIWQKLNTGEPIFPGEAVRTGGQGSVKIKFSKNNSTLELDPDSLIVINSTDKEIALDLMDGSIMVAGEKAEGSGGPSLTLNSEKGKVDLSKTTATLSKTAKGGLDVTVHRGTLTTASGEVLTQATMESINILTPASEDPILLNAEAVEPIRFSWKPVNGATKFQIWLGDSHKELKPLGESNAPLLEKKIPSGRHFYKVVALKTDGTQVAESHIRRIEVIAKRPPGPLAPHDEAYFFIGKAESPIDFKWTQVKGAPVDLEISNAPDFKKILRSKSISDSTAHEEVLSPGDYYWRISAKYPGFEKPLVSKGLHFTVSNKPQIQASIKWDPGIETQKFFVNPLLNLSWSTEPKDITKQWKVRIWKAEHGREPASSDDEMKITVIKQQTVQQMKAGGKYYAVVEAYNENDGLLAKSEIQSITVAPEALLPAPQFEPKDGNLVANPSGGLNLRWTALKDVKEYKLRLLDKTGKEIKTRGFDKNTTSLVNLMPGEYKVDVYAIDTHGRESEKGTPRVLIVPETSGLKAPKIKKVEVH